MEAGGQKRRMLLRGPEIPEGVERTGRRSIVAEGRMRIVGFASSSVRGLVY
jgi:hypothetical protein